MYRLRDMSNDEVTGSFYGSELQGVRVNPDQLWKIEKILKTRGKGNNKEYLVKWLHYPSKFNSYVKARDIEQ